MEWHSLHKDEFIGEYLHSISWNSDEKFQLAEYIQHDPWIYLEIWPWSINIENIKEALEKNNSLLYVGDVSSQVLKNYCKINNLTNLNYKIRPLLTDAQDLPFADDALSGIGCSAVFHEVVTYDWWSYLEIVINEILRCLKPWWVLIYRDPFLPSNYRDMCAIQPSHAFALFLDLYLEFIDQRDDQSGVAQKNYFDALKTLKRDPEQKISLLYLYELKRHFILYIKNVLWIECLTDENRCLETIQLLYKSKKNSIVTDDLVRKSNDRFNREGHELYYYFDREELIIYLLEVSLNAHSDYIIFPKQKSKIQVAPRAQYEQLLTKHIQVQNTSKWCREILYEQKNIIHFFKIAKWTALIEIIKIYQQCWFWKLKKYIENNIDKFHTTKYTSLAYLDC